MVIDSHAHYEHSRYNQDRDRLLKSMPSNGVELIINVGCCLPSSQDSIKLAEAYPHVYATVGVHPHEAKTLSDKGLTTMAGLCAHKKVVALGEIGLDFYHDFSPRDVQRHWFARQLELAHELDMPVVIHSREANSEVFNTIKKSPVRRGVIHSFSGDRALALAYVDLGFHIGVSGVVTYDKTNTLQNAVAAIPLEKILMETDAPYLTPVPFRGKRNQSQYLVHVAEAIATIKGVSAKDVCLQTAANVKTLFNNLNGVPLQIPLPLPSGSGVATF